MGKSLLLFFIFHFSFLNTLAQTAVSTYLPGVTPEGAIYLLPKTGIRISVLVEKTTYTPGELNKYAERYLRIKDVSPAPSVSYRITGIRQEAYAVADTSKHYAIEFNAKTVATNIRLSDDGILLAINAEPNKLPVTKPFVAAPHPASVNPRQYMNEETLAAGSTAKMAELIAKTLDDKKGIDVALINIAERSSFADYFVLVSAGNERHAQALREAVEDVLEPLGIFPKNVEGKNKPTWILMDYRDVIVNVMTQDAREKYSLEKIWGDCEIILCN